MAEMDDVIDAQLLGHMRKLRTATERIGQLEAEVASLEGLLKTICTSMGRLTDMIDQRMGESNQLALPPGEGK